MEVIHAGIHIIVNEVIPKLPVHVAHRFKQESEHIVNDSCYKAPEIQHQSYCIFVNLLESVLPARKWDIKVLNTLVSMRKATTNL